MGPISIESPPANSIICAFSLGIFTTTLQLPFFPDPSTAEAVTVVVPLATAVTVPSLLTVATDVSELLQEIL